MQCSERHPVLILGAGVNGAACARELALNGIPTVVVDRADIAFGATSKSTRLIHGGLRYLEYGEFDLVRESLEERTRLLRLAPQFVRPLRLFIPLDNRISGIFRSALRFIKLEKFADVWQPRGAGHTRGQWLVRMGLKLYEMYARDKTMPRHCVHATGSPGLPDVDRKKFPWMCAYSDAQVLHTERWVLSLFEDARQAAATQEVRFEMHPYHRVRLGGQTAEVVPVDHDGPVRTSFEPALIINATGAWGDLTLGELGIPSRKLFAGTKGSHLITHNERLRQALRGYGIYTEVSDGRLVFILPFNQSTLIGTTDEPFSESPETAVATKPEIDYLISAVNEIFPQVNLRDDDVALHYSGVRPLPNASADHPGAVTRRHWIEEQQQGEMTVLTLIGGKLTTCRALGEQTGDRVLTLLDRRRIAHTRDRPLPGGEDYPADEAALATQQQRIADEYSLSMQQIQAVWSLVGTRTETIFAQLGEFTSEDLIDTSLPLPFVRWSIEQEWVTTLSDLVERRLDLLYERRLSNRCLEQLAGLLVDAGKVEPSDVGQHVQETKRRLKKQYGRTIA